MVKFLFDIDIYIYLFIISEASKYLNQSLQTSHGTDKEKLNDSLQMIIGALERQSC